MTLEVDLLLCALLAVSSSQGDGEALSSSSLSCVGGVMVGGVSYDGSTVPPELPQGCMDLELKRNTSIYLLSSASFPSGERRLFWVLILVLLFPP